MRTIAILVLSALAFPTTPAHAQRRQASLIDASAVAPVAQFQFTTSEPFARFLLPDCDSDRARGREAADQSHSGSGWMAGGFVSGVLLGLIGTAVTWAMANSSAATPDRVPDGLEASCYRDGYSSKAKSKNSSNALTGGLLGTALLVVLIVSASSGSTY